MQNLLHSRLRKVYPKPSTSHPVNPLILLILILTLLPILSCAQHRCNDTFHKTFTQQQLLTDLAFIKEKILNAHINPFTEISREAFDKQFDSIGSVLRDGMTQRDFYFLAAPILVRLNDEHARLADYCITDSMRQHARIFPLKLTLKNDKAVLTENYSDQPIEKGAELLSVNGIPLWEMADRCAPLVFAQKEDRKALFIEQLGTYLTRYCYFMTDDYSLQFASGRRALVRSMPLDSFIKKARVEQPRLPAFRYENINGVGYLQVNTFEVNQRVSLETWRQRFDSIFTLIQQQDVEKLFIDIRNNGGGNSLVGNLLLTYFSSKSYRTYSGSLRKSAEYVDKIKNAGTYEPQIEKLENGSIVTWNSGLVKPAKNKRRFKGKTYIIVGRKTFSSALLFAVTVKDNQLATLVGEAPLTGHPNHFGELIFFTTPHTQLDFHFSVKEWIRPSGNRTHNRLVPDISIELANKSMEEIITVER